jgi:Polyketide cyclase / dehydrase and lipid transport
MRAMAVDVRTSIVIQRPRRHVAAYAADPENATTWYRNISEVEWETVPPLDVGTRVAFVATFLGRTLRYTYEVQLLIPDERLVMGTSGGPFPMETSYSWRDTDSGGTLMELRNRGEPSGFSKLAAPFMSSAMRRANAKDLRRLKAVLESGTDG